MNHDRYFGYCVRCGKPAGHSHGDLKYCCEHHIERGGIPADWHSGCMRATYGPNAKVEKWDDPLTRLVGENR